MQRKKIPCVGNREETTFRGVLFIFLSLSLAAAPASAQTTIHVPGDAASIQAGINAASNGDTVLVAPGTYLENINFNGKSITVTSSGGAAVTIIDGNQNGIVVTFADGEGRQSVINGFTIQNAALPPNASSAQMSDGIWAGGTNPTITNNVITHNRGYGIEVDRGSAYISGNTISYTSTQYPPAEDYGCDYDDGSGINFGGTSNDITDAPIIDHNTIENNVAHCGGGGIRLDAAPSTTRISNNIIANNQSLGEGGGIWYTNGDQVSIFQNLIYGNVAGAAGGGIYLGFSSEINGATGPLVVWITNNTIAGNSIVPNPLLYDFYVNGSQVNFAGYVSQTAFFNDIIVGGDSYAAVSCWPAYEYLSGDPPVAVNSDLLNTAGPALGGWCSGTSGFGNISSDPQFNNAATGDYHLQSGSPAIDSGYNAALGLLAQDLDGNPRIQNHTGISQAIVDMGVYEAAGSANLRSASQTVLTAQSMSVEYGRAVNLTATVENGSSSPLSSGTVSFLDDWSVIAQSTVNNSGTATFASSGLAPGTHWMVASFGGNTGYDESVSSSLGVTVNGFATSTTETFSSNPLIYLQPVTLTATVSSAPGNPISGTTVAVAPGATTANTAVLTVTPTGGFTGSVVLTAAITSSPAGAVDPPTLSFAASSPVNITGPGGGTDTLTISTTAATSSALAYPQRSGAPRYAAAGGAALAWALLFCIRRRSWPATLGVLLLLVIVAAGVLGCGGGGGGGTSDPGTTAGTYTVTVTGTSGPTTATDKVTLTVQ